MDKRAEAEFDRADRAIARTAQAIVAQINKLLDSSYEHVHPDYLVEQLFLALLREPHDLSRVLDHMRFQGPATLKLANALADYRDSRWQER